MWLATVSDLSPWSAPEPNARRIETQLLIAAEIRTNVETGSQNDAQYAQHQDCRRLYSLPRS